MSPKKVSLLIILALSAICTGASLGLLDIFGFIDGRHALSFTLLLLTAFFLYISLITVFLLEFAHISRIYVSFAVTSIFFFITFFILNQHIVLSLTAAFSYGCFLTYSYSASIKRSRLYIRFVPREIFFPILKTGFTYFLIIMAILAFAQSQRLISENSLISTSLIRLASRPTIMMMNQQINSQLSPILQSDLVNTLPPEQRDAVIYQALEQTTQSMSDPKTHTVYGFKPSEIPVQEAHVDENGHVDITPVIDAMLPSLAFRFNEWVKQYAAFAPLIIAALSYLLLQPIIIPLQLVEALITLVLFKALIATKFITLKKVQQEIEVPSI